MYVEKFKNIVQLQIAVFMYSCVGILVKKASQYCMDYGFINIRTVVAIIIMVAILGLYAVIWQKILNKLDLTFAYMNKASEFIWSLLWAYIIFNEEIRLNNMLGISFIAIGIVVIANGN